MSGTTTTTTTTDTSVISVTYVNPKCFYCGKTAYKVRAWTDNRLVCRECEHKE